MPARKTRFEYPNPHPLPCSVTPGRKDLTRVYRHRAAGRGDPDAPHNGGFYDFRSHDAEELRVTPHIRTFYSYNVRSADVGVPGLLSV